MGLAGPDQGAGGKYLFLPPGYDGDVPDGYFVSRSPTYSNWIVIRALDGIDEPHDDPDLSAGGRRLSAGDRVHQLRRIAVQRHPLQRLHLLRGGQHDRPGGAGRSARPRAGRPDRRDRDRQRPAVRTRRTPARHPGPAAKIAGGLARTLLYKPRDPRAYYYPDGSWKNAFVGGSYEFLAEDGARLLDLPGDDALRRHRHHPGDDPCPCRHRIPVRLHRRGLRPAPGSTEPRSTRSDLPAGIPAKTFWSIDIYDTQTRALLQTDNPWPSINSFASSDLHTEDNGDTVIHFGPTKPEARESTGSRPSQGKAGSRSCASTARSNPGSTRPGAQARSNPSTPDAAAPCPL